jgi:excinuclease ABC subunit A
MLRKDKINEAIMKWFKEKMVEYTCPDCGGKKLKEQRFNILINDKNIHEIVWMQLSEVIEFLENLSFPQNKKHIAEPIVEEIRKRVALLVEIGLDYLSLGRRADTISGSEAQRIKLASELGKIKSGKNNLYILDEPTTGLHISDIKKLMNCLDLFIEKGHSILVIEHNLEVLKMADHIIDLGPEGGKNGGFIVAQGTPEEIISIKESITGEYLKKVLV